MGELGMTKAGNIGSIGETIFQELAPISNIPFARREAAAMGNAYA
jgi:hypothetical protein